MAMNAESLTTWMESYRQAWEGQDPAAAEKLFASDYAYKETPFTLPIRGPGVMRRYWEEYAVQGQRDIHFGYAILAVPYDQGIVHWRTELTLEPSGNVVHLDGIAIIKLDDDDKCVEFEQWWHRMGGNG